ncbi:hypothetical protein ADL27_53260 [Streptomyces sp. NRRL F-6602]|nr:hypothetical protein ADL27_53260 [Streptomyces sp. NRRL F-6602]
MNDRDRTRDAIDRLAAALEELAYTRRISITPEIRVLLVPDHAGPEDVPHMHSIGITPEAAELAAQVLEQVVAARNAGPDPVTAGIHDYVFATVHRDLANAIDEIFSEVDTTDQEAEGSE